MTKTQYRQLYRSLVRQTAKDLRAYAEHALKSGAFDLKSEPAHYRLPKNVLSAACHELGEAWGPLSWDDASEKQIRRIRRETVTNWATT